MPITQMPTSEIQALIEVIRSATEPWWFWRPGPVCSRAISSGLTPDRVLVLQRTLFIDRQLTRRPRAGSHVRTAKDREQHSHHPATGRGAAGPRRARPALPARTAGGDLLRVGRTAPARAGVRQPVAPRRQGGGGDGPHVPQPAALLRLAAHPARRVGQDRAGPARARRRRRDPRHLQHLGPDSDDKTHQVSDAYLGPSPVSRASHRQN